MNTVVDRLTGFLQTPIFSWNPAANVFEPSCQQSNLTAGRNVCADGPAVVEVDDDKAEFSRKQVQDIISSTECANQCEEEAVGISLENFPTTPHAAILACANSSAF